MQIKTTMRYHLTAARMHAISITSRHRQQCGRRGWDKEDGMCAICSSVALAGHGSHGKTYSSYLADAETGWETDEQEQHFISEDTKSYEEKRCR